MHVDGFVVTRPSVVVLDYGSGNIRSAQRALERVGADVTVTADPHTAFEADGLVVPGVGAFAACMAGLNAVDGAKSVRRRTTNARPVLGICVGMQVLFESGDEHGTRTAGCGEWPGRVRRLDAPVLPHIGWNTVVAAPDSGLLRGVQGERFYFVHSYAVTEWPGPDGPSHTLASWTQHGEWFVSVLEDGLLSATQFHPEKSGDAGATVLENWLAGL
jgi:imidazole glycerol-phosphate synthase subunit HisH